MPTRPPRSPGVRRRLRRAVLPVLVAVTAAVAGVGVSAQPASAHNSPYPWYQRSTFNDGRQCTYVDASQNHGPSASPDGSSTRSATFSFWADCSSIHRQHPYWIGQKGVLFGNGTHCLQGGWQYNVENSWYVSWVGFENYSFRCSRGAGVPLRVSHDLYQKVFNPYIGGEWWNWSEARPFGTTYHDYRYGPSST